MPPENSDNTPLQPISQPPQQVGINPQQGPLPPSQPLTQTPPSQNLPMNNFSVVPIIISIVGGVLYCILLAMNLIVLFRVVKLLNVTGPIGQQTLLMAILSVVALTLIVFANFGFAFFLIAKRKKGEGVNKAVLASIVISVPPIIVQVAGYFLAMNLNAFM